MSDFNNNQGFSTASTQEATNEGLRKYMLRVYNYMGLGLAFTALIVLFLMNNPALMQTIAMGPMKWVLFAGVMGLGFFSPKLIFSGNQVLAQGAYWLYAALWGAMIAPMVAFYLATSPVLIVQALAMTVLVFAGMSLVGYTTKKDLSGFGAIAGIALLVVIGVSIINVIFIGSSLTSVIISAVVVFLIAGITAYETQQIKQMYYQGGNMAESAIFGAFMLFGSFITLFINLLSILGFLGGDD